MFTTRSCSCDSLTSTHFSLFFAWTSIITVSNGILADRVLVAVQSGNMWMIGFAVGNEPLVKDGCTQTFLAVRSVAVKNISVFWRDTAKVNRWCTWQMRLSCRPPGWDGLERLYQFIDRLKTILARPVLSNSPNLWKLQLKIAAENCTDTMEDMQKRGCIFLFCIVATASKQSGNFWISLSSGS